MGLCREIYQEGLRIPPVRIMRSGAMERDVLALLLNNVRTPDEREGDLGAQIAACHTGAERLREVCQRYGLERAQIRIAGTAGLLGADDARVLGARAEGNISGRRLHGQRRNQRTAGEDCGGGEG